IYLANPSVAPEDVLHAIAFELQLKLPKNADRLKVMQVLQAHLLSRHAEGRQVVIFVEEAQGMPLATLEEIRLLSNLETKQDKLLQIVLFGQPELDANLSETHIRQLRERITHSFHLEPLGTKDIGEYLILRLRAAGYHGPHLFSDAAIKKLSRAAEGLARRVNILADKSLLAAFADNVHQVTPKHVKAAIQDSEFGRKAANYKQYFIGTILLIALLAVFISYGWWQYQNQPKITAKASASQSENIAAKTNELIINDAKTVAVASPIAKVDGIQTPAKAIANPVEKTIDAKQSLAKLSLIDKRLEVTQNLLASAQPSTITLQIKSLPTDAKLSGEQKKDEQLKAELERLSQQLEIDNIYLYRKMQSGVMYTVILYGDFTQRSDALAALKNLPEPIKNSRPYLRTFAGISRDIEQTQ
ncbi:AAA family ATPase, partial [Methylotenera sp.]|uniref:AAA family ATPase n=1 Tax=Methylotenera sp. TaxID=2051956 RepID=UPI0027325DF6